MVRLLLTCFLATRVCAADAVGSFTIRADWYDRGNVVRGQPGHGYANKYPTIWNAGKLPNVAEYDIEFPLTAE